MWGYLLFERLVHIPIPLAPHPWFHSKDGHHSWSRYTAFTGSFFGSEKLLWLVYTMNIICMIWTIVSVEMTLIWTGVSGVYTIGSTGQLIPFIIGIVSMAGFLQGLAFKYFGVKTTSSLMNMLELEICKSAIEERLSLEPSSEEWEANFQVHSAAERLSAGGTRAPESPLAHVEESGRSPEIQTEYQQQGRASPNTAEASEELAGHDVETSVAIEKTHGNPSRDEETHPRVPPALQTGYTNQDARDQQSEDKEETLLEARNKRYPQKRMMTKFLSLLLFLSPATITWFPALILESFCIKAKGRQDSFIEDLDGFEAIVAQYLAVRPFQVLRERQDSTKNIRLALRDESLTSLLIVLSKFLVDLSVEHRLPETEIVAVQVAVQIDDMVKHAMLLRVRSETEDNIPQEQHEELLRKWNTFSNMSLLAAIAKDMQHSGRAA